MSFCPKCGAEIANAKPSEAESKPRINRMPELILGVIGGVLGLLFIPVMVFLGGFMEAYTGDPTTLYAQATVAALVSIIGLVAAVLVKSKPREWGICLVICGVIGAIVASGFYVGGLLLLVAGVLAVVRKDPQEIKNADLSFLTEPPIERRQSTGLKGSFSLDAQTINDQVTKVSPGVYALGVKNGKIFHVHYVGHSDVDVNADLKKYLGKYDRFKFDYTTSPELGYDKECDLYHMFRGPQGRLDNYQHPHRPSGVTAVCPICGSSS